MGLRKRGNEMAKRLGIEELLWRCVMEKEGKREEK